MAIMADHAPNVAGSVIMLTTVALFSYAMRVYCRLTRGSWSLEDWIMTGALVCDFLLLGRLQLTEKAPFAVLVAGCIGGAFNGIGVHVSTLQEPGNEKYTAGGNKVRILPFTC